MDDNLFEDQMKKLKSSYESIPTISSSEKIINEVKKAEKPIKRRIFFQLPYIASFIGILLIGGILGIQLLTQTKQLNSGEKQPSEEIENQPVTETEIETSINETRGYYERKVDELKEKLGFEDVEQYGFVQEARDAVEKFETRKDYSSKVELTTYMEKVKEIITLRVSMPHEEFKLLEKMRGNEETLDDQYILNYINKLELLHERYYEKWELLYSVNLDKISNVTDYVEKLNSGNVGEGSNDYLNLVDTLKSSGYTFIDEGEGIISFKVDYEKIATEFSGNVTNQLTFYLEIQQEKSIKADGEITISREELKNRLLDLEMTILKSPTFENIEQLKGYYQDWINIYLTGIVNQPITNGNGIVKREIIADFESLVEDHPNTDTSKIVQSFLNTLKENDLILTKELKEEVLSALPTELKPAVNGGISKNLLPITDQMIASYEEFKESFNSHVFEGPYVGTNTIDIAIARIYMYAIEVGDYETAYFLTYKGADSKLLDKNQFLKEIKQSPVNYQRLSNEVIMLRTNYEQNGEMIEHTFIKENGETIVFRMRLENGYPKVEYDPVS
ncbi:MAG: hypothetical protein ACQEWV_12210 [Bacillota bacterium]